MRTVISLAVGFWLGRQLYLNYDREAALQKERRAKEKLKNFLERHGWPKGEANVQAREVFGEKE